MGKLSFFYRIIGVFVVFFSSVFCLTAEEGYYIISSSQDCGDLKNESAEITDFRKRSSNNVITWSAKDCELESQIVIKCAKNLKKKTLLDTLETVPIKCYTRKNVFILDEYKSFKDMGLTKKDLNQNPITLTFDSNGNPLSLYIGVPFNNDNNLAPIIIPKEGNDVFFCRGELHSFEASVPFGISESEAYYRWYIDGVEMTGRNDRWFDTYSRTNWEAGEHVISCDVSVGKNGKKSPKGEYRIVQLPGSDCSFSVKAVPYWGADCESDAESSDIRYNEKRHWGSVLVSPIEEYVHFYMEIINKKILTSTITNDPNNLNFQLVQKSEVDVDYAFFLLPVNFKAYAKEPFTPTTVYFKIEDTNINFSTIPYISPKVSVFPDSVTICERAFQDNSDDDYFTPKVEGFDDDDFLCKWFYSEKIDGEYRYIETKDNERFFPNKIGYYKVLATDGVFEAWSKPVMVLGRTDNCISVTLKSVNNENYTCKTGTLLLEVSPIGSEYTYQWKYGNLNGKNLKNVENATKSKFKAPVSKENEAWFVEVSSGGKSILSNPFVVKELPELPSSKKLELEAFPKKICKGRSVELVVHFNDKTKSKATDSLGYIYEWYKVNDIEDEKIDSIISDKLRVSINDVINDESEYYVVVKGCNGEIRSSKNIEVELNKNFSACSSGIIYVNKNGNDYADGLTWETAYSSIDRAILSANEFRNIPEYKDKRIDIRVSEGLFYPVDDRENAYEVPSNTQIVGGYDSLPKIKGSKERLRNPKSPVNVDGNATILRVNNAKQRLFYLKNVQNVTISGFKLDGESILKKSSLNGRAIYAENSKFRIDSCLITGFYADKNISSPIVAVALTGEGRNVLTLKNTTFTANMGGQIGACLGILSDGEVNICSSTFTNNTTQYYGGVAILSYNCNALVNVYNSTFYDNTCPQGLGYYGRSVLRMVGGKPTFNLFSCTVSDRFYKEDGTLNIYNSILECAGKADVYENNFPAESSFTESEKNVKVDNLKFLSNFSGTINKLKSAGGFTQVLIPTNKIGIVGKAGKPHKSTLVDQRGKERNLISSTFGAYEETYFVAIKCTDYKCVNKQTIASFVSSVSGLKDVEYQWVNNYSDIEGATLSSLSDVGIGTYWLEVKGKDEEGKELSLRSNEIRICDICADPGIYYVKTRENGGDDQNSGFTWNQPFATLEKALEVASDFANSNPNIDIVINVAAGVYSPKDELNNLCKNAPELKIIGSYPANATKGDKSCNKDENGLYRTKIELRNISSKQIKWRNVFFEGLLVE